MTIATISDGEIGSSVRTKLNSTIAAINGMGDVLNVKEDYGAKGDGVTDDTTAFVNMFAAASSMSRSVLYIPAGLYIITALPASLRPYSNMTIKGDGMNASVLWWKNSNAVNPLIGGQGNPRISNVVLQDFGIRGNHDSDFVQDAHTPIIIGSVDGCLISRVQVAYARGISMAVRDGYDVSIEGCWVHHSARDGISTADCSYARISGNTVEFCDDDSIACHTNYLGNSDRGTIISGNLIRLCQGIRAAGVKTMTITGNTLEFCWAHGINVSSIALDGAQEGHSANSGITIAGNLIKNCLDRATMDNLNQTATYIVVSGAAAQAGTSAVIPGENNPATGTFEAPYQYFMNIRNSVTTAPVPSSYNVVISGNTCIRDIYATAQFSDYGFGVPYLRTGPLTNFPVVANTYLEYGVQVFQNMRNVLIDGNIFAGLLAGLFVGAQPSLGTYFRNNIVYDCTNGVVFGGSNTFSNVLHIDDNIFDCDPFHLDSNRGTGANAGTYLSGATPVAILLQSSKGISFRRNIFRNCARICDKMTAGLDVLDGSVDWDSNIIEADPVSAPGFSASNRGVGFLPLGANWIYRIVDCNPNNSTYGQIKNNCITAAAAMPTAGIYVRGHFVKNTTPSIATGKVVLGWLRLTTGSAHVANTDWAACFVTNS